MAKEIIKRCPKCNCERFLVTAHVTQGWMVDGKGNYLKTTIECDSVTHNPDDDDIWVYSNCGFDSAEKILI